MRVRALVRTLVAAALLISLVTPLATAQDPPTGEQPKEPAGASGPGCGPQAVGGPDTFGYTYRDSAQPDGPAYDWVEIEGTGTVVLLGDDEYDGPFPIGFPFNFYGSDYSDFYVQSNGALNFDNAYISLANECPVPVPGSNSNLIALMWDDLDPGDTSDPVYYRSFAPGACPYGSYAGACLVVQYTRYHHYQSGGGGGLAGTFEAILFDNDSILLQYQDAGAEEGSASTTGIENADGSDGLTYACDTAGSLRDGRAVQFYYPGPDLTASRKLATPAVEMGQRIDYAIDIVNTGNQAAAAAVLTDVLPEGTAFIDGSLACSSGTCWYDAGDRAVYWNGEVARSAVIGARPTQGTLLTGEGASREARGPSDGFGDLPHEVLPASVPPGTVLETFPHAWDTNAIGMVYDPNVGVVRYAHQSFTTASIWDVGYAPPHNPLGNVVLSAVNPGWPASLDERTGIAYNPVAGTYLLSDFYGDNGINAWDNIIEIAPGGTILNAWETSGADNDSYDGSSITTIVDVAVVPGTPPRYFATAAFDGNVVYEIDLIRTGSWWAPMSWGTVQTCTIPGLTETAGIDYDAEHGLLYHSDENSPNIVVTDLNCNVVDAFSCASPQGFNTGVTYVEGMSQPEIWVTDYNSESTTRCAAPSVPACGRTVALFTDDFEGGLGDWALSGLWNEEHEADTCGSLVAPFPSSDTGAYFGLDATCTYSTGARVTGTLELDLDVDLSAYTHAALNFWSYEETECGGFCSWDRRYVDVSTDGGENWATVWASTGPEGEWYEASATLWGYTGGPLRVRFRFDSGDAALNGYFGWLVDNIELVACPLPVHLSFAVEAPDWCGPVVNEAVIEDPEAGTVTVQGISHVMEELYQIWDFELDGGGFVRDLAGEWEWGAPTYPPGLTAHSGRYVWGTDLHGDADDEVGVHRLARSVSLPTHPNGVFLSWWDWNGAEASDCTNVTVDGTLVYGRCDHNQPQWTYHVVDLSAWAGQTVDLEFDLEVCCVNPGPDGWYIDDVAIQSGCIPDIEVIAPPLEVSLCTNSLRMLDLSICDNDNLPVEWYIWEMESTAAGGAVVPPAAGEPPIAGAADLERTPSEELPPNLQTARAPQPSTSHHEGSSPSQLDILVCSDSCQFSPPNTCPEVALQNLGESYDLYFQDWAACETAINSGAYDVVVIDNACYGVAESLFSALDNFLLGGGQVFVNTYNMDSFDSHPFWDHAGVTFVSDVTAAPPPPIYGWGPGHPVTADWPSDPLQFDDLYVDDGDKFDAHPNSLPLAGYTAAPTAGEGGLALRYDNQALVSGFCIDNLANRDDDSDGVSDCVEVWQGGLGYLLNPSSGIPWLSEDPIGGRVLPGACTDVRVTFDASGMPLGDYTAALLIRNNDPDTPVIQLPATMHVVCNIQIYLPVIFRN